jgi:ubiquitin C-terminal hydrolase
MDMEYTELENLNKYDHTYDNEYDVSTDEEDNIKLGVSRYNNIMGVTCYMNSILHILQQIPSFVKYIYDFEFEQILLDKIDGTNNIMEDYVIYELHRLFKTSLENDNSTITPITFKNLIGMKNDMWDELNHQDSQEFFNFLISQIKEEVGQKVKFIPSSNHNLNQHKSIQDSIDNIIATNALTIYQSHEYSPLTELFDGLYENTCLCACCQSTSIKFEPFLTLAVDITTSNDLYDSLDHLCHEQQLDLNNKLVCSFCGLENRAYKKTLLWKTPKILVIHIKRFGIMEQKITTNVTYPIKDLDMTDYIDPKSPFKSYCKYDLIGINLHQALGHSSNINAGHYTSIVKSMVNNNWYLYNDSDEPELQLYKEELQDNNASLLFYYRHN